MKNQNNKGWFEKSDQKGKAPEHVAASMKAKLSGTLRQPMKKETEDDESQEVNKIIKVKTKVKEKDEMTSEEEEDDEEGDSNEEIDEDNANEASE